MVEKEQKNDFNHTCQQLQLCNETLQEQKQKIEEQFMKHSELHKGHTYLSGM